MIAYRDISDFKYQLAEDCRRHLPAWPFGAARAGPCIVVTQDGYLLIRANYPWDGPSGPTVDRKTNLYPSLYHDVGYELIRAGVIPGKEGRLYFDKLFRQDCIACGMSPFWANWFYYKGLRLFGGFAAKRRKEKKYRILRE